MLQSEQSASAVVTPSIGAQAEATAMRHLYLLRNCKADAHGRLDEPYEQTALALADYMQARGIRPSVVLCSPERRTRTLLELLAPALASDASIIQLDGIATAKSRDLLSYLRSVSDDVDSVMLIGRHKALKKLASRLTGSSPGTLLQELRINFPPLGMAAWALPPGSWRKLKRSDGQLVSVFGSGQTEALRNTYFDYYDGANSYEDAFKEFFSAQYVVDMFKAVWGVSPPYTLLDAGSANGMTLKAFAKKDIDAWGIENSAYIHSRTPRKWRSRNLLADVREIPFPDQNFDFTYETCLCYVAEGDVDRAIREMRRVTRQGLFFGSLVREMGRDDGEGWEDVFFGTKSLHTTQQWSERFLANGFRLAITDDRTLKKVWKLEKQANDGWPWYPNRESMRYCFYTPC